MPEGLPPCVMVVVLATAAMSGFLCMLSAAAAAGAGEVLYNGIVLPALWPPRDIPLSTEPPPLPPYLVSPPAVIPIDVGRQLFVDDFLIEQTTLKRTWHLPVYYDKNPVITSGIPFSDGVWWDPNGQSFKMWYVGRAAAGDVSGTCYATSKDGLTWDKPALDLVKNRLGAGTNVLLTQSRDSGLVWLDPNATDPSQRFKMSQCDVSGHKWFLRLYASPDGIHWTQFGRSGQLGDRSTFFYNPFRKVWVFSIRDLGPASQELLRFRRYSENADFLAAAQWPDTATTCGIWHQRDLERAQAGGKPLQWDDVLSIAEGAAGRTELPVWAHADNLDPRSDDVGGESFPQLYNLDATPYESLMLGLFSIWRGGESVKTFSWHNEIFVGFSRDGFHWHRPAEARQPFLPRSNGRPERWNYTNVQSAGGGCLVMGDRLYFYCSGRSPVGNATGVAFLRRDGFASMDGGREGGSLTTRPVRFAGCRLFVNVDAANGELAAEILDEQGNVIAPFSRANCARAAGDSTLQPVNWKGAADLSSLAGRIVRFRFHLRQGKLYAFWVSPDASGASGGYVAAGGQGLTGPTDTVGEAAYRDIQPPLPHKTAPFLAKGSPRQAQKAGTTEVSISVRSDEPVVCRYALKAGVLFDKMDHAFTNTGGLLHTTKVSGLKDGAACTLYIKARDEAGNICEDYSISFVVADARTQPFTARYEVQDGALKPPMMIATEGAGPSLRKHACSPEKDKGSIGFGFRAPSAGDYYIWALVKGPTESQDSFYVMIDGQGKDVFDAMEPEEGDYDSDPARQKEKDLARCQNWRWTVVNGRDGRTPRAIDPRVFPLVAGEHTVTFQGREPGAMLARIAITNDPRFKP